MLLINIFEIVGTIAFAVCGALIAAEKKLDLFGVIFLSITTAVGGGIFRDIIIGNIPPIAFVKPEYCIISIVSGIITFKFYKKVHKLKNTILITDAIGLGVFTAVGSSAAFQLGLNKPFIVITMGLLTGIGGGILRDLFVRSIPYVFVKEIYAVASILGALSLYYTIGILPKIAALYICFAVTFLVRIISIKFNINLPASNAFNEKENIGSNIDLLE